MNTNQTPHIACQICGKSNHTALDCYHRMDYTYQGRHPPPQLAAMAAQMNENFQAQDWLADSGANTHITADTSNINNPQPFDGTETVGVGNGAGLYVKGIGSSFVHCKPSNSFNPSQFLLKDILHCPNASANLLSINKFCIDNNCWFALTGSNFFVKDNLTGAVLLQGPSENGLYPIPLHHTSLNKWKGFTAYLGVKTTDTVWHQRLGHPSLSILQHLLKNQHLPLTGSVDKTKICPSCQLGKSKQQPFFESTRVSTGPLDLIHSDVWTSPVTSLSGYKYYVIFIDDYSRFCWLYPILNKSDVYQCFVKFKLFAENILSTKIKQFQSDNGGEYISNQFKHYLTQNGILHRLTCPHTSQQNGIAERKHRHIMEMGLTLLAQAGLSPKYWVDSFLTSTYLINRLPTPVLKNQSPFSKLFNRAPDYTSLRSFGCLCFPLLRPYANHKLSFRSKPCILLGYAANQKGYRCLEPQSHKIYISRHVVFDENVFPAKGTSLSQGSCQITATPGNSLVMIPSHVSIEHLTSTTHLPPASSHSIPVAAQSTSLTAAETPNPDQLNLSPTNHQSILHVHLHLHHLLTPLHKQTQQVLPCQLHPLIVSLPDHKLAT
jgi:transposase InsO family protein